MYFVKEEISLLTAEFFLLSDSKNRRPDDSFK
jgi:hypothetical protein